MDADRRTFLSSGWDALDILEVGDTVKHEVDALRRACFVMFGSLGSTAHLHSPSNHRLTAVPTHFIDQLPLELQEGPQVLSLPKKL